MFLFVSEHAVRLSNSRADPMQTYSIPLQDGPVLKPVRPKGSIEPVSRLEPLDNPHADLEA
jgi:hypothetical protein